MDNDDAGQAANKRISDKLFIQGIQHEILVPNNKDWNEDRLAADGNAPCHGADLYPTKTRKKVKNRVRYYNSDHRRRSYVLPSSVAITLTCSHL